MTTFQDLNLSASTLKALDKKGFTTPSPIQEKCIPLLLHSDHDVIGQAQTGTGKTAAFSIPILEKVSARKKHPQALILAPTRELAVQVAEEIYSLKGDRKLQLAVLYGGASMGAQLNSLKAGAQIVVGTPGRVLDHIDRKTLKLDQLDYLILDEADEMLNMGFLDDIKKVLHAANEDKRMLLFSATMPKEILHIAKNFMHNPEIVKVAAQQLTTANTEQVYFEVKEHDKGEAVTRIIDTEKEFYGIIFCRTKSECDGLSQRLKQRGYLADALHGDMDQKQRTRVMKAFKEQKISMLVATDIAARGIDVDNLTHVINYHIPQNAESYTHRIGRTGRAGRQGVAITFVTPREYKDLVRIRHVTKGDITKKELPSVDQIIDNRKQFIVDQITAVNAHTKKGVYGEITQKLLEDHTAEELVAKLVYLKYHNQLDDQQYRDIEKINIDTKGTSRLFIARGRSHGFGPKEIVQLLKDEAGVTDADIDDVRVLDEFSFVNCPFEKAEIIIHTFQQKEGRSIVNRAKEKSGGNSRGGRRDDRRGGGRRNFSRRR